MNISPNSDQGQQYCPHCNKGPEVESAACCKVMGPNSELPGTQNGDHCISHLLLQRKGHMPISKHMLLLLLLACTIIWKKFSKSDDDSVTHVHLWLYLSDLNMITESVGSWHKCFPESSMSTIHETSIQWKIVMTRVQVTWFEFQSLQDRITLPDPNVFIL